MAQEKEEQRFYGKLPSKEEMLARIQQQAGSAGILGYAEDPSRGIEVRTDPNEGEDIPTVTPLPDFPAADPDRKVRWTHGLPVLRWFQTPETVAAARDRKLRRNIVEARRDIAAHDLDQSLFWLGERTEAIGTIIQDVRGRAGGQGRAEQALEDASATLGLKPKQDLVEEIIDQPRLFTEAAEKARNGAFKEDETLIVLTAGMAASQLKPAVDLGRALVGRLNDPASLDRLKESMIVPLREDRSENLAAQKAKESLPLGLDYQALQVEQTKEDLVADLTSVAEGDFEQRQQAVDRLLRTMENDSQGTRILLSFLEDTVAERIEEEQAARRDDFFVLREGLRRQKRQSELVEGLKILAGVNGQEGGYNRLLIDLELVSNPQVQENLGVPESARRQVENASRRVDQAVMSIASCLPQEEGVNNVLVAGDLLKKLWQARNSGQSVSRENYALAAEAVEGLTSLPLPAGIEQRLSRTAEAIQVQRGKTTLETSDLPGFDELPPAVKEKVEELLPDFQLPVVKEKISREKELARSQQRQERHGLEDFFAQLETSLPENRRRRLNTNLRGNQLLQNLLELATQDGDSSEKELAMGALKHLTQEVAPDLREAAQFLIDARSELGQGPEVNEAKPTEYDDKVHKPKMTDFYTQPTRDFLAMFGHFPLGTTSGLLAPRGDLGSQADATLLDPIIAKMSDTPRGILDQAWTEEFQLNRKEKGRLCHPVGPTIISGLDWLDQAPDAKTALLWQLAASSPEVRSNIAALLALDRAKIGATRDPRKWIVAANAQACAARQSVSGQVPEIGETILNEVLLFLGEGFLRNPSQSSTSPKQGVDFEKGKISVAAELLKTSDQTLPPDQSLKVVEAVVDGIYGKSDTKGEMLEGVGLSPGMINILAAAGRNIRANGSTEVNRTFSKAVGRVLERTASTALANLPEAIIDWKADDGSPLSNLGKAIAVLPRDQILPGRTISLTPQGDLLSSTQEQPLNQLLADRVVKKGIFGLDDRDKLFSPELEGILGFDSQTLTTHQAALVAVLAGLGTMYQVSGTQAAIVESVAEQAMDSKVKAEAIRDQGLEELSVAGKRKLGTEIVQIEKERARMVDVFVLREKYENELGRALRWANHLLTEFGGQVEPECVRTGDRTQIVGFKFNFAGQTSSQKEKAGKLAQKLGLEHPDDLYLLFDINGNPQSQRLAKLVCTSE